MSITNFLVESGSHHCPEEELIRQGKFESRKEEKRGWAKLIYFRNARRLEGSRMGFQAMHSFRGITHRGILPSYLLLTRLEFKKDMCSSGG